MYSFQKAYFNTSHVNVNLPILACCAYFLSISIHLMLMLIRFMLISDIVIIDFNTSHVNVNPQ